MHGETVKLKKKSSHVKSHQILSVQSFTAGAELLHADGQRDRINLTAVVYNLPIVPNKEQTHVILPTRRKNIEERNIRKIHI